MVKHHLLDYYYSFFPLKWLLFSFSYLGVSCSLDTHSTHTIHLRKCEWTNVQNHANLFSLSAHTTERYQLQTYLWDAIWLFLVLLLLQLVSLDRREQHVAAMCCRSRQIGIHLADETNIYTTPTWRFAFTKHMIGCSFCVQAFIDRDEFYSIELPKWNIFNGSRDKCVSALTWMPKSSLGASGQQMVPIPERVVFMWKDTL